MKIAIPTAGGHVDEHFGHARTFTIFTLSNSGEVLEEETFYPHRAVDASPLWE